MSKALELFEQIENIDENKYYKTRTIVFDRDDMEFLYEAIAELEAQEAKSCEVCKYFRNSDKACFESSQNTYIRPASIGFSGCGKFELKNNICL